VRATPRYVDERGDIQGACRVSAKTRQPRSFDTSRANY
jgi:hypothetical protein